MDTLDEIKRMRQEVGMTQVEFGEYFGIPRRTLQDWERGVRTPPEYVVRLIAYRLLTEGMLSKDGGNYEKDG